ncbi:MAG: hypothetical protein ACWGMZ_05775, partial [Thermoguttaceae bacterium]
NAEVKIQIGSQNFEPVLAPDHSLIVAEIAPQKSLLFSPLGTLTSKELDLLDVPGNNLLLDRFLPEKPVAVGDTWKHSEKLLALFLCLDEVGSADVHSTLKEVTDRLARFEMSGKVAGAVEGVSTEIEIKARYRFDRKRNCIDWLGMLIKEKRNSSPISDGLDVVSQLQITEIPADKNEHLSDENLKELPLQSTPELLRLSHYSKLGGWELSYDRNWHICRDQQDVAVLRRLENGELIAQCNLSSLPSGKSEKLVSLEEFQEDVKRALGKDFKEFVEAEQTIDEMKRRVLRVLARGTASELPILWTYYHIADKQGRRMGCVFTLEEKYAERFGKADQDLLRSLKFKEQATQP